MAWDDNAQKSGTVPGAGRCEAGYADISADSWTVEVPTRFVSCYFALGVSNYDSTGSNTSLLFTSDCDVSSAAVTYRRAGPYNGDDVRFRYIQFGW